MDPEVLALAIPITAILVGGLIAITSMMAAHQRKMAELYRKDVQSPQLVDEIRALRSELAAVKDRVNQQLLSSDASRPRPAAPSDDVQGRLRE